MRLFYSWLWTKIVNTLFGLRLKDVNCAFKLYRREILEGLELESKGAFINAEIFARIKNKGGTIGEVGVHHFPRIAGKQTGANLRIIFRAFWELFQFSRKLKK